MTLFFGYATLSDPDYMKALLSNEPKSLLAILPDYTLMIQSFQDMPPKAKQKYKGLKDFKTYFIQPGGRGVHGRLWYINGEDERTLDGWHLEGVWHKKQKVTVANSNGNWCTSTTYIIKDGKGKSADEAVRLTSPYHAPRGFFYLCDREQLLTLAKKKNLMAGKT